MVFISEEGIPDAKNKDWINERMKRKNPPPP
jgi:hypothetical protein